MSDDHEQDDNIEDADYSTRYQQEDRRAKQSANQTGGAIAHEQSENNNELSRD